MITRITILGWNLAIKRKKWLFDNNKLDIYATVAITLKLYVLFLTLKVYRPSAMRWIKKIFVYLVL